VRRPSASLGRRMAPVFADSNAGNRDGVSKDKKARTDQAPEELDEKELENQKAEELPDREALSIVDVGDSLGSPPVTD
jgi:hypothetical protein